MGKLLFIDSDDINGLSEALKGALERRGVIFKGDRYGEFDYPFDDNVEEDDYDPYLGIMPKKSHYIPSQYGGCGGWADEANYGSCGRSTHTPSYGGCGGSGNRSASCGSGGCGVGYNYYPRC